MDMFSQTAIVLLFVAGSFLWLVPGYVASRKNHPQASAIWACVFCSLLFPPAWIVGMVWACTVQQPTREPPRLLRPSERRDTATAMEQTRQAKELMERMP